MILRRFACALLAGAALTAAVPANAVSFSLTIDGSASTDRPVFSLTNTTGGPTNVASNYITSFSLTLAAGWMWEVDRVFGWDASGNASAPALRHVFVTPNGGTTSDRNGESGNNLGDASDTALIEFTGFNPGDTARWKIDSDRAWSIFTSPETTDFRLALMGATATVGFGGGQSRTVTLNPWELGLNLLTNDTSYTIAAVPEPATWATMMLGFGLVGAAARRRRQLATVAA